MIAKLHAYGLTYIVVLCASSAVAAAFLYFLLRGLRTGAMPLYRGVVYRDRHPGAFRAAALLHILIAAGVVAMSVFILWASVSRG